MSSCVHKSVSIGVKASEERIISALSVGHMIKSLRGSSQAFSAMTV